MAVLRRLFALAFVCLASLGSAQLSDQLAAERILGPRWRQMSRSAGTIFSGTVLSVETQAAGKAGLIPVIVVRFQVHRAIAGVRAGQVLTVREWTGVWPLHRAMREGQRLLIFLYPPSRLGLTSPVGGPQGQVVLGSRGEIVRTSAAGIDSAAFAARLKSCPSANLTGVGVFPGYGAFPQGQCGSENSVVPPGLESFLRLSPTLKRCSTQNPTLHAHCAATAQFTVTLRQLERAIRGARENASAVPARIRENASAASARSKD